MSSTWKTFIISLIIGITVYLLLVAFDVIPCNRKQVCETVVGPYKICRIEICTNHYGPHTVCNITEDPNDLCLEK